jgi:hypothetical protein
MDVSPRIWDVSPRIITSLPADLIEAARKALNLPDDISGAELGRAVFAHAAGVQAPLMPSGAKPGNARNGYTSRRKVEAAT